LTAGVSASYGAPSRRPAAKEQHGSFIDGIRASPGTGLPGDVRRLSGPGGGAGDRDDAAAGDREAVPGRWRHLHLVKDQDNNTGNTRKSFLKFNLAAVTGSIAGAKLMLYGSRTTGTTQDAAYAVSNNDWAETAITWNSKPAIGAKLSADVTIGTTAQYYEFDVSSFVMARKAAGTDVVSLVVLYQTLTNNAPDTFNSREAATNPPLLIISQ
jgi:hypothetical protein